MLWFLKVLFLCCCFGVKTALSRSNESIKHNINEPDEKEVNYILGRILQADKFDELADRIADRAVKKLNDFQKTIVTEKIGFDDGIYRSQTKPSLKQRLTHKHNHKHGKINVDAVLKKAILPLGGLKLRYKYLNNKHANTTSEKDNDVSVNTDHDEGSDIDLNMKTISDENFDNPFGTGQTVSWDETSKNPPPRDEQLDNSFRSDTNDGLSNESKSGEKDANLTRTTRTEGDKQFVLEDHPDYKEYNEQMANIENRHEFDFDKKIF
ncbi:uncharacterized protein LOC134677682 [Cydia fagiglandana]|uniref:uncharacterized protein LOC134677682 n=1 Tax=Cydia fagiglandana TaxID=1458189 RepID=UPI002FEE07D9